MNAPLPAPEQVFDYAADRIQQAANSLWPDSAVRLGPHVPSVTAYVRHIEVDGRPLFAKLSFLGVSLASLLRGACGPWPEARARQDAYIAATGGMLERETIQYGILHTARLRAPKITGYTAGVLFTEPITGSTLTDLVVKEPARTADLLAQMTEELAHLRQDQAAALVAAAAIPERSVPATFHRKFNGLSSRRYLALTGQAAPTLAAVVGRLLRDRLATPPGNTVVFGDLKPEHVIWPTAEPRPAFLDPGMSLSHPCADYGKVISRLTLALIADPPGSPRTRLILDGVHSFAGMLTDVMPRAERAAWLRALVAMWMMDATSILTTYLTAPTGLPLPDAAQAVIDHATAVCTMLDRTTADLNEHRVNGPDLWLRALNNVATAVRG
ncbi:hypothetical protein CIB93_13870 [Streptomyces sp. WZ.A104]|uniref:phosphotransferase n=1 Tax=Streptomyces sp. WZ.A104 TaxID=2023771 RepID=UPI000BBBBC2D|nr:phosphotransferase [Streptomyces sp. WZ.A104]PCG85439.1 hypothetical protein CIB93_13870 [Streptomyces sp. WZ.A104]